ncbi:MAG: GTP cyclohydrolase II [Austwickia sp.]|nr:MAG: GTP cyclohydrolase II [Austwickia sp.]
MRRDGGDGAGGGALVTRVVETRLPTRHGTFRILGYRDEGGTPGMVEHVAMVMGLGDGQPRSEAPLVRVHSECLTGDVLGSRRCDCGEQLDAALARVAAEREGVVIYVRGHEGRGIGLVEKLRAYRLQDDGVDTLDANLQLGHVADARDYRQSAAILRDLGLRRIRLMSSNPSKEKALAGLGIEVVERTGMFVPPRPENAAYLDTKRARMGHDRPGLDAWAALLAGHVPPHPAEGAERELVERYGDLASCGPRVTIAQLGQSLDGFIASRTGDADFVTGELDRAHLHRLRALVDAVVVGAGTVVADDCRLTVRAVPGEHPVRVVLDPRARVPLTSQVLSDGVAPTLWLVGAEARTSGRVPEPTSLPARVDVAVVPVGPDGHVEPAEVLRVLRGRGLGRVLVEGGGLTVSSFFEADVLDRLYLTVAPVLIGDGVPGLRFDGEDRLADALRAPARRFLLGEDTCTELVLHT